LTAKTNPTLAELKSAWTVHKNAMSGFSASEGKNIIFTEIGYQSRDGTNIEPWWREGSSDEQEQADCYRAAFEEFWDEDWLEGMYWWHWYYNYNQDYDDFAAYGKPARGVAYEFYCNPVWDDFYGACLTNDTRLKYYLETSPCNNEYGIPADNSTYVYCDYCTPDWYEINESCQPDDTFTGWYNDTNDCYSQTGLSSDNNSPANNTYVCDYCTPNMVNGSWSGWYDITGCRMNDTILQERNRTEYDSNSCGEVNDTIHYEYQEVACDYCTPNVVFTNWTDWENEGVCLINDSQKQNRSRVEYDENECGEVTNTTHWESQHVACDYCVPDWQPYNTSCIDGNLTQYYEDDNGCFGITGLSSDLIGQPANQSFSCGNKCVVPYDGMKIENDTVFCSGNYNLPNGIEIESNVVLDCNGSVLIGENHSDTGILVYYADNAEIKNCTVKDYYNGIQIRDSDYNLLLNNNVVNNIEGIEIIDSSDNKLEENNMSDNNLNFGVRGNLLSDFIQDIGPSNKVDNKPIYYLVNQANQSIPLDAGYAGVVNSNNIDISGLNLSDNLDGIMLAYTRNSHILNNNIDHILNGGIYLLSSWNNTLSGNHITGVNNGCIKLRDSDSNMISDNNVSHGNDGIMLYDSDNNVIFNNEASDQWSGIFAHIGDGIHLENSFNNLVLENSVVENRYGIRLRDLSGNNTVMNNKIDSNHDGMVLIFTHDSTNDIYNNTISNNDHGIHVYEALNNTIYSNEFLDNTEQVQSSNYSSWDFAGEGNHWSDYDEKSEGCVDVDANGICDSPYIIDINNQDNYPVSLDSEKGECNSSNECGIDGYVEGKYCNGDDVVQLYGSYSCVNPGENDSYCDYSEHEVTRDTCEDGCLNGSCAVLNEECVVPFDGMNITEDIIFCEGNYNLPHGINIVNDNVVLDCNGISLTGSSLEHGITIEGYSNVEIKNCDVSGFNYGIYAKDVVNVNIHDNEMTDTLRVEGQDSIIKDNEVVWAQLFAKGDNITISENYVYNTDHVIRLYRLYNSVVVDNVIPDFASWGRGISMDGVYNTVIENNTIENGGSAVYCWYQCNDLVVRGNNLTYNTVGIGGDNSLNYRNLFVYRNVFDNTFEIGQIPASTQFSYNQEGNRWLDYDEESEGCVDTDIDGICDDAYEIDTGFVDEYPLSEPLVCYTNSDCWKDNGWIGEEYCSDGNVYQDYRRYTCNNPATYDSYCSYEDEPRIKAECDNGCSDGICLSEDCICSSDDDCGSDSYVGNSFCSGEDVYKVYRKWDCHNPGTDEAYCSYDDDERLIEGCANCVNGACADSCSVDSDCGEDRWVGSPYCSEEEVWQTFGSWSCNAGTCEYNENDELKESCSNCFNGGCVDDYGESDKQADVSVSGLVLQYPNDPKAGETTIFAFNLRNTGEINVEAEWILDTGEEVIRGFNELKSGEARIIARQTEYSTAGSYDVKVIVDPNGEIDESDEGNNNKEIVAEVN